MTDELPGSIRTLTEEESWELVDVASVGRLGFVDEGEVKIIPINYMVDVDVIIRTLSDGIIAQQAGNRVTFEVDYHSNQGSGWSVLMHGELKELPAEEADLVNRWNRVLPWAGGDRSLFLVFHPDYVNGRRVTRLRN